MTKQEKIDKIYEVIASRYKYKDTVCIYCGSSVEYESVDIDFSACICSGYCEEFVKKTGYGGPSLGDKEKKEVVLEKKNPVMIGDVLDWIEERNIDALSSDQKNYDFDNIISLREYKRKSILDQPDNCVDFIYNLLKNE